MHSQIHHLHFHRKKSTLVDFFVHVTYFFRDFQFSFPRDSSFPRQIPGSDSRKAWRFIMMWKERLVHKFKRRKMVSGTNHLLTWSPTSESYNRSSSFSSAFPAISLGFTTLDEMFACAINFFKKIQPFRQSYSILVDGACRVCCCCRH